MDLPHFDRLARSFGASSSRRAVLGLLGGVLAALGLTDTTAKKKKCGPCKRRRKRKCKGKKPDGTSCPGGSCQAGTCVATPAPVSPATPTCGTGAPCHVFITSTTHNGDLGGLSGADAFCQGLAEDAGLPGTYMAWLSDDTGSPATRFPTQSTGPYRLVDGTTIANNWADLTDGTLAVAINITETGDAVAAAPPFVWTHTKIDGTAGGSANVHCENWTTGVNGPTGDEGSALSREAEWTEGFSTTCNGGFNLYCFQQS